MIHISRNPEDKTCYKVMIVFGKNKSYIDYNPATDPSMTLLRQNIGDAARFYGKNWDEWVEKFDAHYKKICKLSKRVNVKISNLKEIPPELEFYYINIGCFFTLHEITFLDWYTNKHKLNG